MDGPPANGWEDVMGEEGAAAACGFECGWEGALCNPEVWKSWSLLLSVESLCLSELLPAATDR